MTEIWNIWNAIHGIVASADMITLAIAVAILLAAGYLMQAMDGIVTTTLVALIAFALAGYVRAVTMGGQKAAAFATTDWHAFLGLNALTLLAYAITFAVGIAVAHLVLGLVRR